jgi:acetyltransferase-like isoleucine patch superfamily enzyme
MKRIIRNFVDIVFFGKILPRFLAFYEKRIMYRVKESWGIANIRNIKNVGENVKIVGYSRFLDGQYINIGNNVRIGYGCFFFGKGGITIGDNSILSRNITIYSSNHDYSSDYVPYNNLHIDKPVFIGQGVWIGMNVCITPGVVIGDGAIIGMGTVVSRNVEPGAIVVGFGQKEISGRKMEDFYKNLNEDRIFSKIWPNN